MDRTQNDGVERINVQITASFTKQDVEHLRKLMRFCECDTIPELLIYCLERSLDECEERLQKEDENGAIL